MQKDIIVVGRFQPFCKNHAGLFEQASRLGRVFVAVGQPDFERAKSVLAPNAFSKYTLSYPFGLDRVQSWIRASVGGMVKAVVPVNDIFSETDYAAHLISAFLSEGHRLQNPALFSENHWTVRCFARHGIETIQPIDEGYHASDVRGELFNTGKSSRLACELADADVERIRLFENLRQRIGDDGELLHMGFLALIKQVKDGHTYEVVMPKDAVVVLFIDKEDNVWFIQQYRPAIGKYIMGLPAETLDKPGKTPLEHAVEGLREEIGIKIEPSNVEYITTQFSSEGHSSERVHLFIARGDYEYVGQRLEDTEKIEILKVKLADAARMAFNGELEGSKTAFLIMHEVLSRVGGLS